jgi:hypothetical protein
LPSAGGAQATRPARFAKIENVPPARPQSGLDKADVVYEAVAEGGVAPIVADLSTVSQNLSSDTAAGAPAYQHRHVVARRPRRRHHLHRR